MIKWHKCVCKYSLNKSNVSLPYSLWRLCTFVAFYVYPGVVPVSVSYRALISATPTL